MKKFGIIAGAGSMAGVYTYKAIIEYFAQSEQCKDSSFPHLKIINYPFKSTDKTGVFDKELSVKEIKSVLSDMEDCDYVFILCNSIHAVMSSYFSSKELSKIISLPQLVKLSDFDSSKKTLVVSSQSSGEENLFGFLGGNVSYLDEVMQDKMNAFIQDTIENKKNTELTLALSDFVKSQDYEQIVLGCTELYTSHESFIFENLKTINPCDILAKFIYDENKKSVKEHEKLMSFMEKIFPSYLFSYEKEPG